jgi:hypothetical protein
MHAWRHIGARLSACSISTTSFLVGTVTSSLEPSRLVLLEHAATRVPTSTRSSFASAFPVPKSQSRATVPRTRVSLDRRQEPPLHQYLRLHAWKAQARSFLVETGTQQVPFSAHTHFCTWHSGSSPMLLTAVIEIELLPFLQQCYYLAGCSSFQRRHWH